MWIDCVNKDNRESKSVPKHPGLHTPNLWCLSEEVIVTGICVIRRHNQRQVYWTHQYAEKYADFPNFAPIPTREQPFYSHRKPKQLSSLCCSGYRLALTLVSRSHVESVLRRLAGAGFDTN